MKNEAVPSRPFEMPAFTALNALIIFLAFAAVAYLLFEIHTMSGAVTHTNAQIENTNAQLERTNEQLQSTNQKLDLSNRKLDLMNLKLGS
jgi:hypothetical protein